MFYKLKTYIFEKKIRYKWKIKLYTDVANFLSRILSSAEQVIAKFVRNLSVSYSKIDRGESTMNGV